MNSRSINKLAQSIMSLDAGASHSARRFIKEKFDEESTTSTHKEPLSPKVLKLKDSYVLVLLKN